MKSMTIAEIKEQVLRVEGFEVEIEGRSTKKIDANLHSKKKTSGDMLVAEWIANSFPEMTQEVFVLRSNGSRVARSSLEKVRNSYPEDYKRKAKLLARERAGAGAIAAELAIKKDAVRRAKQDYKKTKKAAVLGMQTALQTGERNAAFDAIETALHITDRFHPRVIDSI